MKSRLVLPFIPVIICTPTAILLSLFLNSDGYEGVNTMDIVSSIPIVVSVIGVAGALLGLIIQFKKDSNKIGDVKADTNQIKPVTDTINENVKEIKNDVIRTLLPKATEINNINAGVESLVEELKYKEKLKHETSLAVHNKDYFITGVEKLYEENSKLAFTVRELQRENQMLLNEVEHLKQVKREPSNR